MADASMGPRIFIRGNRMRAVADLVDVIASMGPRIFIRGNVALPPTHAGEPRASMGPRIFIRGNWSRTRAPPPRRPLQWGRGSSSAETSHCRRLTRANPALQWGRGSSSAETIMS